MAEACHVFLCLALWVSLSAAMIIFNASLLRQFHHPIWLTFWHQAVSTALISVLRIARPDLLTTGDAEAGTPPLTILQAVKIGFPVVAAQCVGLISSNTAVMYISVSFCQMIKAWTPACVYAIGCLFGTQKWSWPIAKTIAAITFGLMITSVGEVQFDAFGFGMQVLALFSEGLRINMLEIRLRSQGYKLNPLTSTMVFAPIATALLFCTGVAFDGNAVNSEVVEELGELALAANGLIAFCLNIAIYIAIQVATGLVFALAGIVKDISIVMGSVFLLGTPVSLTQVIGYAVALGSLQAYGVVSKTPDRFESGVVRGLLRHLNITQDSSRKEEELSADENQHHELEPAGELVGRKFVKV